jgi:glycosyltransferase involved in cell wall biosynthesis
MNRSSSALVIEVLRSEGPRAVADRMRDRWQESFRRRRLVRLDTDAHDLGLDAASPPVLNLSPIPPAPKRGGSHIQMLDRLAEERRLRTVALAYPRHGSWWLEMWAGERAGIAALGEMLDPAAAAAAAARLVGADGVHVENLHDLPLELVPGLEARGLKTSLSIHDFVLFCRRPHLIDASTGDFCEYSRDEARCSRCLARDGHNQRISQEEYRRLGGEALRSAGSVVFPSAFLQRRHRELFPERRPDQLEAVIAPASARPHAINRSDPDLPRIAFVGGVYRHKGGALIPHIMAEICKAVPSAQGVVYGSGEAPLLDPLRRDRRIRVRGYYRQGRLPRLLERDRIAVAILPSIWPEAYAIVVDECLAAGVPVVAFDLGAVGERSCGAPFIALVGREEGWMGLAKAAVAALVNPRRVGSDAVESLPTPETAAREHIEFHELTTYSPR